MAGAHRKSCNTGSKFLPEQCRPLQLQYLHYITCSLCIKKVASKEVQFWFVSLSQKSEVCLNFEKQYLLERVLHSSGEGHGLNDIVTIDLVLCM